LDYHLHFACGDLPMNILPATHLYEVGLAVVIGAFCAILRRGSRTKATMAAAEASFIICGAFMLFSEKRWWPAGQSIVVLGFCVLVGWIVAWLGHHAVTRVRK
jgi:hypothetical protein